MQAVFDTTAGVIVFIYALTQGLLPRPPELPDIPAFDISFWAANPQLLVFFITALGIGVIALFAVLARRAEAFWERIKQGVVVLTDIPLYLRVAPELFLKRLVVGGIERAPIGLAILPGSADRQADGTLFGI